MKERFDVFTLGGVPGGFSTSDISGVAFNYGTSKNLKPGKVDGGGGGGGDVIPESVTPILLALAGGALLAHTGRRRRARNKD